MVVSGQAVPLQNYGKPTFIQSTAQGQLLGSIGKERYGGKVVEGCPFRICASILDAPLMSEGLISSCSPPGRNVAIVVESGRKQKAMRDQPSRFV